MFLEVIIGTPFHACSPVFWWSPGEFGVFLVHQVHWAVGANSFLLVCTVSSVAKAMQCCLIGVWPFSQTNLNPLFPFFFSFVHQLLSSTYHSLNNKSIRYWMIWAACLVCDAVMVQELLELLGIVAWTIVILDFMRQTQLCDNHKQFYPHSCRGRIG